jgi:hypothetical protein
MPEASDRTRGGGAVSADEGPRRLELVGDEADLFREFNPRLVNILRGKTNHRRRVRVRMAAVPDRERAWRGWLVTTAEREVWRLCRAERDHALVSIDDAEELNAAVREPRMTAIARRSASG